jgi:hypothetical protein
VSTEQADIDAHVGAQAVVIIRVGRVFPNCGRYIHRGDEVSKFVPRPDHEPPIPDWKRLEVLRPMLPVRDQEALARDDGTTDGNTDGSDGSNG